MARRLLLVRRMVGYLASIAFWLLQLMMLYACARDEAGLAFFIGLVFGLLCLAEPMLLWPMSGAAAGAFAGLLRRFVPRIPDALRAYLRAHPARATLPRATIWKGDVR